MAPIVNSVEIARRPEDVFSYVTDPSRLGEWQESVVSSSRVGDAPPAVGSRAVVTRRAGPRQMTQTMEFTELTPPSSWALRGLDSPVRGKVRGTVEPLDGGERSRVTIALDFEGKGIGTLLVPLVVRRLASAEMPRNLQRLKERLEGGA